MFEVVFLGTSASAPSAHRGLSAHMVLHRQYRFLIDCGEGTQRQILRSGLGFKRLDKVLLTHSHLDHILGLGGLVSTLTRWETLDTLQIYGGKATLDRVHDLIYGVVLRGARPPVQIDLITIEDGDVIMEDSQFKLSAFSVTHRGPGCLGFLFEEKSRRPFLVEKADGLGVPFGPERGQLVRGTAVMLSDGRTVEPDDVLGELIPGTKYVHVGDVGRTDNLYDVCRNADALTIEATYLHDDDEMARQFGHMTARRAAQLAADTDVKALLLTHLSRRYYERDIWQEARNTFANSYVARDLDHFIITRHGCERVDNSVGVE
ncbi:MAG: ribonuclease Z [Anaerolineae bacterium]|nr:ribonuclease Z [Anaerolineae bacterium]